MTPTLKHRIEYGFVKTADFLLFLFPRPATLAFGEALGTLISWILRPRNKLIKANLAAAFPEKSNAEIEHIAKGVWRNLGRTAVEFVRLSETTGDRFDEFFFIEGKEQFDKLLALGKGSILIGFHFTNWEVLSICTGRYFGETFGIARPMKNPLVEAWVQSKRSVNTTNMIWHRQAAKASLRVLKNGKNLGILVDQNLYTGGVFVNFFGRPAATTTLPALLHSRTDAPVVLIYSLREGTKFKIVYEPIPLPEIADMDQRIFTHTQLINNSIEAVVRRTPENWFWIHNRWKRKPEPATPEPASPGSASPGPAAPAANEDKA